MITREQQNRTLKALAIAELLNASGVPWNTALAVPIAQGPFWPNVVKATGRTGILSIETKREALYYLAAMQCRRIRRVK